MVFLGLNGSKMTDYGGTDSPVCEGPHVRNADKKHQLALVSRSDTRSYDGEGRGNKSAIIIAK